MSSKLRAIICFVTAACFALVTISLVLGESLSRSTVIAMAVALCLYSFSAGAGHMVKHIEGRKAR